MVAKLYKKSPNHPNASMDVLSALRLDDKDLFMAKCR